MAGRERLREALALELRARVGAERVRRVILGVRARGAAVEDVVGAHVHQEGAGGAARLGERGYAERVHGQRRRRVVLGRVHAVVGSGVHHHARGERGQAGRDRGRVAQVELSAAQGHRVGAGQRAHQLPAELARPADDHDAHRRRV